MTRWEKTKAFLKSKWKSIAAGVGLLFAFLGAIFFGKRHIRPAPPARPDIRPQLHDAEDRVRTEADALRDAEVERARSQASAEGAEKLREVERDLAADSPRDLDAINLRADRVSTRSTP